MLGGTPHPMKSKLKIIIATFLATTAFWCLLIFWLGQSRQSGISFIDDARQRGFVGMMSARNVESQSVIFTVEELRTNMTRTDTSRVVLLQRLLPPSGEFWVGIRKTETGK